MHHFVPPANELYAVKQVRAANLQDLIYKRGQAGITKASVTIVFDNSDREKAPVGFETYKQVTVTRQVKHRPLKASVVFCLQRSAYSGCNGWRVKVLNLRSSSNSECGPEYFSVCSAQYQQSEFPYYAGKNHESAEHEAT